jgi:localization factor PodJL
LRQLTPAENLIGVDHAVQHLTEKIDLIAGTAQDPSALRQLEGAIVTMRGIASHVASNDALAKLSDEVRALTDKVDRAAGPTDGGALSALEQRIATLADALEARNQRGQIVPHELDTVVKGLIDKIERIQLTHADHTALGQLEDRIAKLVEKLDASDARLNNLETIERGLAELLIHLEHQRVPNLARAGAPQLPEEEMEALARDVANLRQTERKTIDTLEAVHGTLGHVVDRLAMIETDMRGKPAPKGPAAAPAIAPVAVFPAARTAAPESQPSLMRSSTSAAAPMPATAPLPSVADRPAEFPSSEFAPTPQPLKPSASSAAERRPIDPNLPPDHPLEPGSSGSRGRNPGSPADRIAASEAALAGAKPPVIPDPAGKSNFIAAARRAAQAAGQEAPAKSKAATGDIASAASRLASRVGKLRTLIAGGSAILLVLGALEIARTLLIPSDEAQLNLPSAASQVAANEVAASRVATATPDNSLAAAPPANIAAPTSALLLPQLATASANRPPAALPATGGMGIATPAPGLVVPVEPARQPVPTPKAPGVAPTVERDITGSVAAPANSAPAKQATPAAPAPTPPAPTAAGSDKPPGGFDAVRTAATKGNPAAQFEVAVRYAEGRGVQQNLTDAAEWFERAAKQGLVPAQFRLGGLYEKGLGVKKDLETARRLYLAAGEAGNAKALHNLAVLYAEGVDGRPDYQTAAKWFRKAADYGVTDSQYNLAILYARGIGVEQNLTEAYRWFALAAREGDADAVKKRDDISTHLDPQSLKAAAQAVQAWAPEPQPEAAVQVKMPAGGWGDEAPTAPTAPAAPKRKPPVVSSAPGPKLDLATPR